MYEISKKDWKLFREKLAGWQENYMEHLNKKYIALLMQMIGMQQIKRTLPFYEEMFQQVVVL